MTLVILSKMMIMIISNIFVGAVKIIQIFSNEF